MRRTFVGLAAVLAVVVLGDLLELGVTAARAQYIGVPVAGPGRYTVRVRPNGMVRVQARGFAAPMVDPMVAVAAYPTTYVTSAPVIATSHVVTSAPVPVYAAPVFAPVPVFTRTYMAAPTYTVVQPRVFMAPAVIGYPY